MLLNHRVLYRGAGPTCRPWTLERVSQLINRVERSPSDHDTRPESISRFSRPKPGSPLCPTRQVNFLDLAQWMLLLSATFTRMAETRT